MSLPIGWTRRASYVFPVTVLAAVSAALLSGFFRHLSTFGAHDWDQMESHRYLVVKSIRDFGQFPFWDPYGCGGFPAWGAPESATIAASLFLPVYLVLPLALAIRFEIATLVLAHVVGCWFFARRYVRSSLGIAFVCLVAALNSRTALQAAVGHTWHLYYAGMPWVLGAFDRAGSDSSAPRETPHRWLLFGAGVLAMMSYGGGIYPVPHTALCIGGLGTYRACARRNARPLVVAIVITLVGGLLAMPKLLPIAETMAFFPRLVRSRETIDPRLWIRLFLSSAGDFPHYRAEGLDYLWHEYGQYVGVLPLALILGANLSRLEPDPALRSLRFVGWSLMVLALGGWGPWVVVHWIPLFRSQHVPSRFTYPAFLLFAPVAAHFAETRIASWHARMTRPIDRALLVGAVCGAFALSAASIAREDALCTRPWFGLHVLLPPERATGYVQYASVPPEYDYGDGDPNSPGGINGPASLLVRRANVGSILCGTASLGDTSTKRGEPRPLHFGARGLGDPLYRGEYWVEAEGRVELVRWSPNKVELSVRGGHVGELLVLNQNWAPGWSANGSFALNDGDRPAYPLASAAETVTFRYRPRSFAWGVVLALLGVGVIPGLWLMRNSRLAQVVGVAGRRHRHAERDRARDH